MQKDHIDIYDARGVCSQVFHRYGQGCRNIDHAIDNERVPVAG